MSDLENYDLLQKAAARTSERSGIAITVKPSNYWIGGEQQTDCYDIALPWSRTGPLNFWFAYGWIEGFGQAAVSVRGEQ